jgi:hypothetical protein
VLHLGLCWEGGSPEKKASSQADFLVEAVQLQAAAGSCWRGGCGCSACQSAWPAAEVGLHRHPVAEWSQSPGHL